MKKYISMLIVTFLLIVPIISSAIESDVDPNTENNACVSLNQNLRYRSRDATTNGEVSTLQDFLQSKGYLNSEPTGYFGLLTLGAVKSFQGANGIEQTGYVGPITRAKIRLLSCDTTASTYPTVSITFPLNGMVVLPVSSTTISVNATDDVGVTKVELYSNSSLYGTDTSAPYSFSKDLSGLGNGTVITYTAKAYDASGNVTTSTPVVVTVNTTTTSGSPVILYISNMSFRQGATLTIYGTNLTSNVQLFDQAGNINNQNGNLSTDGRQVSIEIPSTFPVGNARVRIYKDATTVSNEIGFTIVSSSDQIGNTLYIGNPNYLPSGVVGTDYSLNLVGIGGDSSYNWSRTEGALPPGLSQSVPVCVTSPCKVPLLISGRPTTAGTYTFVYTLTSGSETVRKTFTIVITSVDSISAPTISSVTPESVRQGSRLTIYGTNLTTSVQFFGYNGNTETRYGTLNTDKTMVSAEVPDLFPVGAARVRVNKDATTVSNEIGFSVTLSSTPPPPPPPPGSHTAVPTISSVTPESVRQGARLTIYGTNLTSYVQLFDKNGTRDTRSGNLSIDGRQVSIEIPDTFLTGNAKVRIYKDATTVSNEIGFTVVSSSSTPPPPPPPGTPTGRYKLDSNGNCYWDAQDSGSNQCTPSSTTAIPSTPATLTARPDVCGTGTINLSWSASSGATSYTLYRNGTQIYSGTAASYSNTGLTASTAYTYTVTATNSAGTSSARATSPASTNAPATCVPADPVVTSITPSPAAYRGYDIKISGTNLTGVAWFMDVNGGVKELTGSVTSDKETATIRIPADYVPLGNNLVSVRGANGVFSNSISITIYANSGSSGGGTGGGSGVCTFNCGPTPPIGTPPPNGVPPLDWNYFYNLHKDAPYICVQARNGSGCPGGASYTFYYAEYEVDIFFYSTSRG